MSHTLNYGPGNVCTCRRTAELSSLPDILWRSARQVTRTVYGWIERQRQRRTLGDLDDRFLADIGISRAAAIREAAKPFWM
jgi:uncharacterized protein YjiS (DUF1127 family)